MGHGSNPTVSVLIPAFNASPFLVRAVTSALNQTLKSIEIVIVDDASADNTLALAKELSAGRSNIRVVALSANGGPSIARNAAIDAANGDWLAILDADDAYDPDHLERLCLIAAEDRADVVLSNFYYFNPDTEARGSAGIPREGLPRAIDRYEYVANSRPYLDHQDWGLLKPMLKAAFVKTRSISYPIHSRHGEDFVMMLECLLADGRIVVSPAPTYLYTHRGSGWTRTTVDYGAVAAQSAALISDPRIAHDHEMVRLLNSRISALKRLAGEHKGRTLLENRAFSDLLLQLFTDYYIAQATARFALRRLRRLWSGA
ncbi:glycosyltransferase family 2 protein [Bradyrhizobium genosp. P]|uniref:glycosyltransferase family 2 protein n=1 Tax=Bradyrhizobium genosp. P TaxID=83641 RepID=UPI003CED5EDB